ncbi:MAG: hypothetical protein IRY94_17780, partial [Rhodospirillaceae bacterium]|nr:hypothetical protein [Rhodospirillaceae bacterium]
MPETLLSPSALKLYGRLVLELRIVGRELARGANGAVRAVENAAAAAQARVADVADAARRYAEGLAAP